MDVLNEILVKNSEEFINDATQAISEVLFEAENKTKQDVLDIIEKFTYHLSNTAESTIEHAKNATMDVLNESLERIRHEADIFVENIVTNHIFHNSKYFHTHHLIFSSWLPFPPSLQRSSFLQSSI